MDTTQVCLKDAFVSIPLSIWKATIVGARGCLEDGSLAKIPTPTLLCCDMLLKQCIPLEDFAVRMACLLKFYGFLS
eukprot:8123525-Karenia_brevis.AAC.1